MIERRPVSEMEPWWRVGIAPDRARHPVVSHVRHDGYTLLVVEFDDQGTAYEAAQMLALQAELDRLQGLNAIILVFVHGWKHNARPLDPNLASFELVLEQTARAEQAARPEDRRPVPGVFVGWRGLSFYAGWLTNLTFWNCKTAALRVALGSVRELFGRLRNHRRSSPGSVLIVAGHSFGGLVVFSALAQSLIEIATFDTATSTEPSFANLVLLVNPAFEAARYLPIHLLVDGRQFQRQPPVLVSITANNDEATGKAFPMARGLAAGGSTPAAACKPRRSSIRWAIWIGCELTHSLPNLGRAWRNSVHVEPGPAASATDEDLRAERHPSDIAYQERREGWVRHFQGGAIMTDLAKHPSNPFWVVRASPEVVNGHNGIFGDVFLGFVRKLVAEQSPLSDAGP